PGYGISFCATKIIKTDRIWKCAAEKERISAALPEIPLLRPVRKVRQVRLVLCIRKLRVLRELPSVTLARCPQGHPKLITGGIAPGLRILKKMCLKDTPNQIITAVRKVRPVLLVRLVRPCSYLSYNSYLSYPSAKKIPLRDLRARFPRPTCPKSQTSPTRLHL
ncbi:MAG: hypothetical protein K2K00_04300, partial [Muribaculaceae bacterium]|nr:hypothetical protein [Muribaculaceae bacterium]